MMAHCVERNWCHCESMILIGLHDSSLSGQKPQNRDGSAPSPTLTVQQNCSSATFGASAQAFSRPSVVTKMVHSFCLSQIATMAAPSPLVHLTMSSNTYES